MNKITSYYNLKPTSDYLRGNNPNGNRRIASRIVFLNGHANYDCIVFAHNNKSDYKTGVYIGSDCSSSTGFVYAGLSSTTMSTCKLISFVGCDTAGNGSGNNLIKQAVSRGAKTAVGFKTEITSRSDDGKGWLKKYNDSIANGNTVSQCLRNAVSSYPNLNMSKSVQIAGQPTTAFTQSSISNDSNLLSVKGIKDVIDINADDFYRQDIISYVKDFDSSFNPSDYKVTVNMFDPQNGDGVIIFCYTIDQTIETNKAYICHINNNLITEITTTKNPDENSTYNSSQQSLIRNFSSNNSQTKNIQELSNAVDESTLISLVNSHKSQPKNLNGIRNKSSKSIKKRYFYNYFTDELSYEKVEYDLVNNVIVDTYSCELLN